MPRRRRRWRRTGSRRRSSTATSSFRTRPREVGDGTAADGVIVFPVTATAKQVRPLDADSPPAVVLGKPSTRRRRRSPSMAGRISSGRTGSRHPVARPARDADHCRARRHRAGRHRHRRHRPPSADPSSGPSAGRRIRRRRSLRPAGTIRRMSRLLGIDLGERRIGIAVADSGTAVPDRSRPSVGRHHRRRCRRDRARRREQDVDRAGRRPAPRSRAGSKAPMAEGHPGLGGRDRHAPAGSRSPFATSACRARPRRSVGSGA